MKNLKRELEIEALKLAAVNEEQRRALEAMETSEDLIHVLKLMEKYCRLAYAVTEYTEERLRVEGRLEE